MEDSGFSNPSMLMDQFNQIQQAVSSPGVSINQTKELAGNMLLTMGVPFFSERLKKHVGEDVVNQIKQYASGELNLDDALKFAKNQFQDKILPQAKQTLLSEANKYVPGLDDLDLENASINDVKNFFQQKATAKLKSALPEELQGALPDNFTQADILNKVRTLGSDQALAYAKKTLPPDVYNELEANQDVIGNPSRIAGFINSKLAETKGNITRLASTTQQAAEQQLTALKGQMIEKANQTLNPLREKVNSLKNIRQQAQDKYNQTLEDLQGKIEDASTKLDEFKSANPNATAEDLQPFKDQIRSVQTQARQVRDDFLTGDKDLVSQLDGAQSMLKSNTDLLASKLTNIRSNIQNGISTTRATVEEGLQNARTSVQSLPTSVAIPQVEEGESIFTQFGNWAKGKVKQFTEPITRRLEDARQTTSDGYRPRLMQPDEPENPFSEPALSFRNPALESYYGSELEDSARLLSGDSKILVRSYAPRGRVLKTKSVRTTPSEEVTQPVDQLAPMREMIERQQATQQQRPTQTPNQPLTETTASQPTTEIQPVPTTETTQPLSEPLNTPSTDLEGTIEETSQNIINTAQSAAEGLSKAGTSIASKVTEGLDTAVAATEEVPVLDILMDVGGLIGSILGGTSLLKNKEQGSPIVSGASFEPNL